MAKFKARRQQDPGPTDVGLGRFFGGLCSVHLSQVCVGQPPLHHLHWKIPHCTFMQVFSQVQDGLCWEGKAWRRRPIQVPAGAPRTAVRSSCLVWAEASGGAEEVGERGMPCEKPSAIRSTWVQSRGPRAPRGATQETQPRLELLWLESLSSSRVLSAPKGPSARLELVTSSQSRGMEALQTLAMGQGRVPPRVQKGNPDRSACGGRGTCASCPSEKRHLPATPPNVNQTAPHTLLTPRVSQAPPFFSKPELLDFFFFNCIFNIRIR